MNELLQMLQSPQDEERLQALRQLAVCGEELPREPIYRALGDTSWRVRKEAVAFFMSRPDGASHLTEVVRLLHSEDNAGLRNAAMEILVRSGGAAVPYLLSEIQSDDHDVRKFILDILGEIGDATCTSVLIEALDDEDENVRSAAAENLGKLSSLEAVPALLDAMDSESLWFRFTILEALAMIGGRIDEERLLRFKDDKLLRKALFDCLGRIGAKRAIPTLAEGLLDDIRNVRESAAVALSRLAGSYPEEIRTALSCLGRDASNSVAEMIGHPTLDVRTAALKLLGFMPEPSFAPRLLELLNDQSLAEPAMEALISLGRDGAAYLVRTFSDEEPMFRAYVGHVVGETGYVEGQGFLLQSLESTSPEVLMVTVQALGKIGDSEGVDPLIKLLENDLDEVREAGRLAIVNIGSRHREEVVKQMRPLLEEQAPQLRSYATLILGALLGEEFSEQVMRSFKDPSPLVRLAAVSTLDGHVFEGQLAALKLALTDEDDEVRATAAQVLGRTGDPRAFDPLKLACRDENVWVRSAAVRSLGYLGGDDAFAVLSLALDDSVGLIAIAALEVMSEIDAGRARPHLLNALGHTDEEVVKASLQLLLSSGDDDWLKEEGERLLAHSHWDVRLSAVRHLCEAQGAECRSLLQQHLSSENEDLVRQAIQDCLAQLSGSEG